MVPLLGDNLGHASGGFCVRAADREEGVDVGASDGVQEVEVRGISGGRGVSRCCGEEVLVAH